MHITVARLSTPRLAAAAGLMLLAAGVAAWPAYALAAGQHEVRLGDTLSGIADRYGVALADLIRLNGIDDPDHIVVGQQLTLADEAPPAPLTYTVAAGDSLRAIAAQFGVSVEALSEANALENPNLIYAGEVLQIPGTGSSSPVREQRTYEVKPGDTLAAIAAQFSVSALTIAEINELDDVNLIVEGQMLRIPDKVVGAPPAVSQTDARAAVVDAANEFGVPVPLFLALTWMESGWQHDVVSSVGAVGLVQILPETADWTAAAIMGGENLDWFGDYRSNARVGAAHLRHLLDLAGGDERMAAAAYYQGWENLTRYGMFDETVQYVANVMLFRDQFGP